jgi:hypothetical protein
MEISLTAAGLLADIIGVAFIGFAFLRSDAQTLLEQAKTKWDYSPDVLSTLCEQKADNIIGLAFLFFGFVLQLIGAYAPDLPMLADTFLLGVILFALIGAMVFRRKMIERFEALARSIASDQNL